MAYEYEKYIENLVATESIFEHEREVREDRELEIQVVYAKAKAYDQIKVIHDKHIYDFLNMSETECIEKIGDILEDK